MSINLVIRNRRRELGMTQEQVASYLGVTTPAVNKWENGLSCPDIMLLSPLARLLEIDLNTLLCFNEDLTEREIAVFNQKICEVVEQEGIEAGFALAKSKLQEYPNCRLLFYSMGVLLEGAVRTQAPSAEAKEKYEENILSWYEYAAKEKDNTEVRNAAITILISRYMNSGKYDEARKLIDEMPERPMTDKRFFQCDLLIKQNQVKEARKIIQKKLLQDVNEVQGVLTRLMNIELELGNTEKAEKFAELLHKTAEIFDMWEISSIVSFLQVAFKKKDMERSMALLKKLFSGVLRPWNLKETLLYDELGENAAGTADTGIKLLPLMIAELENSPECEFLRENKEFWELIEQYRT